MSKEPESRSSLENMSRRKFLGWSTSAAAGALVLLDNTEASAQSPTSAGNMTIPWHPNLQPVVLGSGVALSSSQISPLAVGLVQSKVKWQNSRFVYDLLDYTSLTSTLTKMHLNAWAEAKFRLGSGSFSFNANYLRTFDGMHRRWQVDISIDSTAYLSQGATLNSRALKYTNDANRFLRYFGNYAVTAISYHRAIHVLFDLQFTRSYTEADFQATINASYGWVKGGVSASDFLSHLNQWTSLTVTIEVEGDSPLSVPVLGVGDLDLIAKAISDKLSQWKGTYPDPNDAGNIRDVYLTPFSNIEGAPNLPSGESPAQALLINAIAKLAKIESALTRLGEIQGNDYSHFNEITQKYLFDPKSGKLAEATYKSGKQYAYVQALVNGQVAKDPKITFTFQDPEVLQWRVLQAVFNSNPDTVNSAVIIELYGYPRVTPVAAIPSDAGQWGTNWYKTYSIVNGFYYLDAIDNINFEQSFLSNLDPVTGIPHRIAQFSYDHPAKHEDFQIQAITDTGGLYSNAVNWLYWPAPTLFIPGAAFVGMPFP